MSRTTWPARTATGPLRDLAVRLGRDARVLATPAGAWGAVVEASWIGAHLLTYPFGLNRERHRLEDRYGYDDLSPVQRGRLVTDLEVAATPILLVHGMIDNRGVFRVLTRRLRARGFTRVFTHSYAPTTNDVREAAADLSAHVESLVALTGYERIHVIGHSLGGLIARYYVQRLSGHERVHTLVTLGTPHHGSLAAHLVPVRLGRQLRPGSDLYTELDQPAQDCRTRFVVFRSDVDQLVLPRSHARLDHADLAVQNHLVHAVGHMSLPNDVRVVEGVVAALGELNRDGSTSVPGVTSLRRSRGAAGLPTPRRAVVGEAGAPTAPARTVPDGGRGAR